MNQSNDRIVCTNCKEEVDDDEVVLLQDAPYCQHCALEDLFYTYKN